MGKFGTAGFLIAALACLAGPARGQSSFTSTGQFLRIPSSVRSAAMGEAFAALADDASAVRENPAGLFQLDEPQVQLSYLEYLADLNYASAVLARPAGNLGTLGLDLTQAWIPAFNSTADPFAEKVSASDLALDLAWGRSFTRHLALGAGARWLAARTAERRQSGAGLDFGLMAPSLPGGIQAGASMDNILSRVASRDGGPAEKLPATLRLGLAKRASLPAAWTALACVEWARGLDSDSFYKAGLELGFRGLIWLRAGWRFKADGLPWENRSRWDLGGLAGCSLGLGFASKTLTLDYAYVPMGDLGDSHRLGLGLRFPSKAAPGQDWLRLGEAQPLVAPAADPKLLQNAARRVGFDLSVLSQSVHSDARSWSVDLADLQTGRIVRTLRGTGTPPETLSWDGKNDLGEIVAGGIYAPLSLRVDTGEGTPALEIASAFKVENKPDGRTLIRIPPIGFSPGSVEIPGSMRPILDVVGRVIHENPGCMAAIDGHTDNLERDPVDLSRSRAQAVLRYLVEDLGVVPLSVIARGRGAARPRAAGSSPEDLSENRRVEIIVVRPRTVHTGASPSP